MIYRYHMAMFFLHMTLWYLVLSPVFLVVSKATLCDLAVPYYFYLAVACATLCTLRFLAVLSKTHHIVNFSLSLLSIAPK